MHALLLLTPLLCQDPAPPVQPEPAREAWNALLKTYADAAALRLRAHVVLEDPAAHDTEAMTLRLKVEADIQRPCVGRILLDGTEESTGEEPEVIRVEYLGNGKGIFQLDQEEMKAVQDGASWSECSAMFFLSFLGKAWAGELVGAETVSFLPAREDHPKWIGLALTGPDLFGEDGTSTAWLDEKGALRSFTLPIGGTSRLVTTIETLDLLAEADPKQLLREIPAEYEVVEIEAPDFEAGMLPVGEAAPDVRMIGMDDVEFSLSSLRGKTVLLNFWFYH